ncbi:MAG: mechanosensitive ion channel [Alphaproteobacteria bacterium]|nr:mechanosensitive ion channel [Alphaproteobacteria bacterium]
MKFDLGHRRAVPAALFAVLSLIVLAIAAPAHAQTTNPEEDFRFTLSDWNRAIDAARDYLAGPVKAPGRTDELRTLLSETAVEAASKAEEFRGDLAAEERKREALGPPPAEDEAEESLDIREQRAVIAERITLLRGRIAQAELARLTALDLDGALSQSTRARLVERIKARGPLPLDPAVLGRAAVQAYGVLDAILAAPFVWYESLPAGERNLNAILAPLVFIPVALFLAVVVRRVLLRRFGRVPRAEAPSYTRRIVAALAEGIANGLVPASVFLVILLRVESDQTLTAGLFGVMLSAAMEQAIFFVLVVALTHAALSPGRPDWQLTDIQPAKTAILSRRIAFFAAILAFVAFLRAVNDHVGVPSQLGAVFGFTSTVALSVMILLLASPSLWARMPHGDGADMPESEGEDTERETDDDRDTGFWGLARRVVVALPLLASLAAAVGFVSFGTYVISNLIDSLFIAAGAYLLRDLLRETVGFGLSSGLVRDRMAVPHETRRKIKFWVRAVLDPAVVIAAVLLILPIWGVPWIEVTSFVRDALFGFEIGQVRISLIDIAAAILVFVVAMGMTRLLQRTLRDRVLPQTRLDQGIRHSVTAGVGYVGAILGGLIAVTVVGVDLSNIALIAGALSVGIGFGLQNIVNNFVSGLILLVERPIKVGDWVNVGGNEGFVKQINVRATEIETFQKASVIIPNADLLSSAVTNWTHKDRYGRIEVGVGVAYGTDTRKVERILIETARQHPLVSVRPEPFVVFVNFGDSSLDFELRCYTSDVIMKLIIGSDIRHEIDRKFRVEGIEIPFPQRVVHMAAAPQDPEPVRKRKPGQGEAEIDGDGDGPE